jgi:hypothetical protein
VCVFEYLTLCLMVVVGVQQIGRMMHNRIGAIKWKRGWMGKKRRDLSGEGNCSVV